MRSNSTVTPDPLFSNHTNALPRCYAADARQQVAVLAVIVHYRIVWAVRQQGRFINKAADDVAEIVRTSYGSSSNLECEQRMAA
jgi:hypothetical protein